MHSFCFPTGLVKCEHAHAGMKRYNSVTAVYRNRVPDFDDRLRKHLRIDSSKISKHFADQSKVNK